MTFAAVVLFLVLIVWFAQRWDMNPITLAVGLLSLAGVGLVVLALFGVKV